MKILFKMSNDITIKMILVTPFTEIVVRVNMYLTPNFTEYVSRIMKLHQEDYLTIKHKITKYKKDKKRPLR